LHGCCTIPFYLLTAGLLWADNPYLGNLSSGVRSLQGDSFITIFGTNFAKFSASPRVKIGDTYSSNVKWISGGVAKVICERLLQRTPPLVASQFCFADCLESRLSQTDPAKHISQSLAFFAMAFTMFDVVLSVVSRFRTCMPCAEASFRRVSWGIDAMF
jgi:hypothetical protein